VAAEDAPVFERENGLHRLSEEWIQSILAAFSDGFCPVFHGVTRGSANDTGIARGPVDEDGLAVD